LLAAAPLAGVNVSGLTKVELAGGENCTFFGDVSLSGGLINNGGKAIDTLDARNLAVEGDATIKYGDGPNTVTFQNGSTVTGDLLVKTGKNDDVIDTSGVVVSGTKTIDHGKGVDTVL
jgi:hypothetical protein